MMLLKLVRGRLFPALEEPHEEVSFENWRANPQNHAEATALVIANDAPLADIERDINGFDLIILNFPAFTDGRAYSQARLLRERYGFTGEIRARGDVLRDQILFMARCGFDAFEFAPGGEKEARAALNAFSYVYQTAADAAEPVWRRRQLRAAAA